MATYVRPLVMVLLSTNTKEHLNGVVCCAPPFCTSSCACEAVIVNLHADINLVSLRYKQTQRVVLYAAAYTASHFKTILTFDK